jgi:type I restriction enzyme S subunit
LTVPFIHEGIPLASVREVQSFDLVLATAKRTTSEWYGKLIEGGRAPRRGDLIYCRNVSVGASSFVNTDEQFAMGQDVCLIRSVNQNQRYLNYFLHSPMMDRQLAALLVGSTFDRINVAEIKGLVIIVPPRSEQDAICDYLDRVLREVEQTIRNARNEISLLREYRNRLIADVVTGKLDVREATGKLPDETDEAEILDEADAVVEDGDDPEDADPDAVVEEAEA